MTQADNDRAFMKNLVKLKNQCRLTAKYEQMVTDLMQFQFNDNNVTMAFHDKILAVY